jgi:CxxC motif-containing protein (DUF1111 family)
MPHSSANLLMAAMVVTGVLAAPTWGQEAPQGFEAQNGALEDERFAAAREAFEEVETPATGLGVHFNETSCAGCHLPPKIAAEAAPTGLPGGTSSLPGGSGPITELRAGFLAANGRFVPAPGGTLITTRAVGRAVPEVGALADVQNVRDRFITPSLFGAGFVEAVADADLREIASDQPRRSDGRIRGFLNEVPVLEAPGQTAVGRFGWAAQQASLLSFAADAYRNEMGITSSLRPDDNTLLGNPVDDGVADPEDGGGTFGEDVELFADFMRALPAPARTIAEDMREIERGFRVFEDIGCAVCHVPELETVRAGEPLHGGVYRVPRALGSKRFHPYGDFLLHDVGTGPTVLREELPPEAKGMVRTAALWGIGTRLANGERLLHDGSAESLEDAILKHKNTAAREAAEFQALDARDRERLLGFLRSL